MRSIASARRQVCNSSPPTSIVDQPDFTSQIHSKWIRYKKSIIMDFSSIFLYFLIIFTSQITFLYDTISSGPDTLSLFTASIHIAVDANTGVLTFTIPWVDNNENFLYEAKTTGSALIPVVVTYDAEVLEGAAYRTAPNTVEITYDRTGDQDVLLGNDTTVTYTYKFKLKKTDESNAPLDGAKFELYYGSTASETAPALKFRVDTKSKIEHSTDRSILFTPKFSPEGEGGQVDRFSGCLGARSFIATVAEKINSDVICLRIVVV